MQDWAAKLTCPSIYVRVSMLQIQNGRTHTRSKYEPERTQIWMDANRCGGTSHQRDMCMIYCLYTHVQIHMPARSFILTSVFVAVLLSLFTAMLTFTLSLSLYIYMYIHVYAHPAPPQHAEMHFLMPRYPHSHRATDSEIPKSKNLKIQKSKNPKFNPTTKVQKSKHPKIHFLARFRRCDKVLIFRFLDF